MRFGFEPGPTARHAAETLLGVAALLVVLFAPIAPALAHAGPPYPIIVDQRVGPCVVSVWADPDIGVGTFYVTIDPPPGGTVPDDLTIRICVQPVNGRLPEAITAAVRDPAQPRVQFFGQCEFDRQEMWNVRFLVESSAGSGEVSSQVEATPPGLRPFDLALYTVPFVAIALLWARVIFRRRAIEREYAARMRTNGD